MSEEGIPSTFDLFRENRGRSVVPHTHNKILKIMSFFKQEYLVKILPKQNEK